MAPAASCAEARPRRQTKPTRTATDPATPFAIAAAVIRLGRPPERPPAAARRCRERQGRPLRRVVLERVAAEVALHRGARQLVRPPREEDLAALRAFQPTLRSLHSSISFRPRRLSFLEEGRQAFLRLRRRPPLRDRADGQRHRLVGRLAGDLSISPSRRRTASGAAASREATLRRPRPRARRRQRPGARARCGGPRAASKRSPVRKSRGRPAGRSPAGRTGEITAGRIPSRTSASEKTVPSAAIAMSAAATRPTPPPIAAPCASATTGFGQASIAAEHPGHPIGVGLVLRLRVAAGLAHPVRRRRRRRTSAPRPTSTTTRTPGSSPASRKARVSSSMRTSSKALRTSGRASVIRRTGPVRSRRRFAVLGSLTIRPPGARRGRGAPRRRRPSAAGRACPSTAPPPRRRRPAALPAAESSDAVIDLDGQLQDVLLARMQDHPRAAPSRPARRRRRERSLVSAIFRSKASGLRMRDSPTASLERSDISVRATSSSATNIAPRFRRRTRRPSSACVPVHSRGASGPEAAQAVA